MVRVRANMGKLAQFIKKDAPIYGPPSVLIGRVQSVGKDGKVYLGIWESYANIVEAGYKLVWCVMHSRGKYSVVVNIDKTVHDMRR